MVGRLPVSGEPRRRRHSPAVYRRRRLFVLLVLVTLVAIVWWSISLVAGRNGGDDDGAGTAPSASPSDTAGAAADARSQSASSTPTPSDNAGTEDPQSVPECAAGDLQVAVATSKAMYGSGQTPVFTLTVSNVSQRDCSANVGTSQQNVVVGSGEPELWHMRPCLASSQDEVAVIAAGESRTGDIPWDLWFNDGSSCTKTQSAKSHPGTYWVRASLGEISSATVYFSIQ